MGEIETTRQKVIRLKKQNPNLTLIGTARLVGVSKSRVYQILKSENLPTIRVKKNCKKCRTALQRNTSREVCSKCYRESKIIYVPCSWCKKIRVQSIKVIDRLLYNRQKHFFCNRVCLGYFAAKNYGFGSERQKNVIRN